MRGLFVESNVGPRAKQVNVVSVHVDEFVSIIIENHVEINENEMNRALGHFCAHTG